MPQGLRLKQVASVESGNIWKSTFHLSGSPYGLLEFSCLAGTKLSCHLKYIFAISECIYYFFKFIRTFCFDFCQKISVETTKKHSSLYGESMVYCIRNLSSSGSVRCIINAAENRKTVFKADETRRRMKCTRRFPMKSTVWPLCGSCGDYKTCE